MAPHLTRFCLRVQKEASEVFFSVTKLYQSKDANLRRMVYLVIKDVCPGADEVIIITSSLMKDMNSKTDLYRSNAIRVLCSITDSQLLGQIERYLKQVTPGFPGVVTCSSTSAFDCHNRSWRSNMALRATGHCGQGCSGGQCCAGECIASAGAQCGDREEVDQ